MIAIYLLIICKVYNFYVVETTDSSAKRNQDLRK